MNLFTKIPNLNFFFFGGGGGGGRGRVSGLK